MSVTKVSVNAQAAPQIGAEKGLECGERVLAKILPRVSENCPKENIFLFAIGTVAPENKPVSKHLKNISVVAAATMGSRVLGVLRESLTAAVFGTSALASAYATAFQLPNLFRRLLAEGGMMAAFVPTLNDEIERRQRAGAFVLVNQVASWLFVVSASLVLVAMAAFNQPSGLIAIGKLCHADADTMDRWLLAAKLAVILFPYLVFVCLAAAFSAALNTLHRFLEPALSPIWLNVSIIGLLLAAIHWAHGSDLQRMYWLCGGVLLGGFFQMAVPAWALTREGWTPRFDLTRSESVKMIVRLMAPTVLGSSVYLINQVVSRFVGLSLNDTAVSILNYATRLMELPIGVFAVAVSTVVFPLISRYAAQGDLPNMAAAYRKGMRLILFINIPAAFGLSVLVRPIIRMVFQHGRFHGNDTAMMIPVVVVAVVGLPFFSFVNLVLRAFYAQKDTVTPVRAALLSFVVNLVLSLTLMHWLSTVGLAIAGTISIAVQAVYLQSRLARRGSEFAFGHLVPDLLKITLASMAMSLVVALGWHFWSMSIAPRPVRDAIGVALLVSVGIGIYASLAWLLRVEGRTDAEQLMGKFAAKFGIRKSTTKTV